MGSKFISSLSKCDMCGKRDGDLFTQGGLEVCGGCNKTLKRCDNVKTSDSPPKNVASASEPRWNVRKQF